MNRYPVWKYAIIVIALLVGADLHAAQFLRRGAGGAGVERQGHASRSTPPPRTRVEQALAAAGIKPGLRHARRQLGQGAASTTPTPSSRPRTRIQRALIPGPGRPDLHRGAEPAVALAALADGAARAAHVPGPGPARRRALPDAGGHAGGADQEGRVADRRHAHAAARQEHPPCRHHPRRPGRRGALPRRRRRWRPRKAVLADQLPDLQAVDGAEGTEFKLHGDAQARGGAPRAGRRRSSRTSPRCTTGSTNSAWPSR